MLRKIRDIIHPKKSTSNPYGLSDAEFGRLKELTTHPQWTSYQEFLDKLCSFLVEDMLAAQEDRSVLFYRAYISGLRRAGTIVDELKAGEKAKDARSNLDTERAERARDQRDIATFGTGFYTR